MLHGSQIVQLNCYVFSYFEIDMQLFLESHIELHMSYVAKYWVAHKNVPNFGTEQEKLKLK